MRVSPTYFLICFANVSVVEIRKIFIMRKKIVSRIEVSKIENVRIYLFFLFKIIFLYNQNYKIYTRFFLSIYCYASSRIGLHQFEHHGKEHMIIVHDGKLIVRLNIRIVKGNTLPQSSVANDVAHCGNFLLDSWKRGKTTEIFFDRPKFMWKKKRINATSLYESRVTSPTVGIAILLSGLRVLFQ